MGLLLRALIVEIVGPKGDTNEDEITLADLNISNIDLGPSTLEGDIHNPKNSVDILALRLEEIEKVKNLLEEHVEILSSYIRSIIDMDT